ncbi:MAG TPA: MarR family transcriptional regulator [Candidatus Acetatifactor stercoripullorum]|uniref:MarR family transcriptional regulator n=1 Tax=Candidatus Acetatifactor stercoripullorum TaxID=2838414 RepID=A0A9D1R4G9_9FIRM|nr:helix-turn-helix domain-containing protein [Candidatus Acetatifactor stercoripullorum]HIW81094.1 MarR family transcriptional regulator [Candidatus Acetatifactor stercoripullorum]
MKKNEDYSEAIQRLVNAINKIDGAYYFCAKSMGIKENTLALLSALDDGRVHTQKQICEDWLIPKTTINTVVKELIEEDYILLGAAGPTREKTILLTEKGRQYADGILKHMRLSEQQALESTLQNFSPEFVDAFECFSKNLCDEFQKRILDRKEERKEI